MIGRIKHYIKNTPLRAEIRELKALAKAVHTTPKQAYEQKLRECEKEIKSCMAALKKEGVSFNQKFMQLPPDSSALTFDDLQDQCSYFGIDYSNSMGKKGNGAELIAKAYKIHQEYHKAVEALKALEKSNAYK